MTLISFVTATLFLGLCTAEAINVSTATREEHCLALAFSKKHYAFNGNSATLERLGCYATHGSSTTLFTYNTSAPDVDSLRGKCATLCQLREDTARKAQFTFADGRCGCIPRSSFVYADAAFNSSVCCAPSAPSYCTSGLDYRVVYELELLCPLNFTLCTNLKYCRQDAGCCLPVEHAPAEQQEFTSGSMLLAQWAGGLLVIAGVGHLTYLIALRRHRRMAALANGDEPLSLRERHERRLVLPNLPVTDDAILLVGLIDLEATAARCVDMFSKCRSVDEGDSCTICLEAYDSSTSEAVETPCHHKFHRDCIVEFIQHKLRTSLDDLVCPMCRATILCQVIDDGSELGRLRQTIVEMREGHRPPRRHEPSSPPPEPEVELEDLSPSRNGINRIESPDRPPRRRRNSDGSLDAAMAVLHMEPAEERRLQADFEAL
eukprot:CAMPEP_0174853134 /NCGR_PEP_ID=MMETSP1114-20130205/27378_1 /TAXON_ID=312471 /ORGANISM="Neobodo designis, Strain CCAP 1951/1" /LENGTH=432 /DNA_ID=CAMNT_0016087755 /DNA_START=27 /DNA_END=1321 /DNA_ORIENTATION=-